MYILSLIKLSAHPTVSVCVTHPGESTATRVQVNRVRFGEVCPGWSGGAQGDIRGRYISFAMGAQGGAEGGGRIQTGAPRLQTISISALLVFAPYHCKQVVATLACGCRTSGDYLICGARLNNKFENHANLYF